MQGIKQREETTLQVTGMQGIEKKKRNENARSDQKHDLQRSPTVSEGTDDPKISAKSAFLARSSRDRPLTDRSGIFADHVF